MPPGHCNAAPFYAIVPVDMLDMNPPFSEFTITVVFVGMHNDVAEPRIEPMFLLVAFYCFPTCATTQCYFKVFIQRILKGTDREQ